MENKKIFRATDYSQESYHCQYLVIGTGAGGSIAGALLAEKGFDVILLEEGPYYPTESFTGQVGKMTQELYRNGGIFPFLGFPLIPLAEGSCVGGGTVVNGAGIFHTPKWILEEWQRDYGLKGYGYSDLKDHFVTIDSDIHVVKLPIKEGTNQDTQKLVEGAEKLGWRTEMVPRAAKECTYLNSCSIGCPTGAKQSTLVTYLPRALEAGARIFSDCQAVRIEHENGKALAVTTRIKPLNKKVKITFDNLIIAGGAVQTPHLLRRSGLSRKAGQKLEFHMNVKVIARLKEPVQAEKGTMFPVQVHEFEREDMYINTSVVKPQYLAMSLSPHGNQVVDQALKDYDRMVIFNTTIRAKSQAHIFSLFSHPLVWYKFDPADLPKIKRAIGRMSQLLLECGAEDIYLPLQGVKPLNSPAEITHHLKKAKANDIELNTVHMMASCPMGSDHRNSVVDLDGRLRGTKNIWLADASILPTNIGQSPQGTIMALVHEIMGRHLKKLDDQKINL
ncbi:hypothetical protein CL634_10500 [bacterium]|nr:hypothetical protein [bacterium]